MMQVIQSTSNPGKNTHGFTMIEMIAALLILGIIGAVVISRVSSTSIYALKSQAEVIKGHLRYAQARAMSSEMVWGIQFSGTSYSLFRNNTGDKVPLPGADSDTVTLPPGITVDEIVSFDSLGIPYTGEGDTRAPSGTNISVSTETISITQNTGFIK